MNIKCIFLVSNHLDVLNKVVWRSSRRQQELTVCLFSGSQDRAVLLYEYVGKKTVDLQHTEVPDAYRGRGIAKHLAKVFKM